MRETTRVERAFEGVDELVVDEMRPCRPAVGGKPGESPNPRPFDELTVAPSIAEGRTREPARRRISAAHRVLSSNSFFRFASAWKKLAFTAPTELPRIAAISSCGSS